MKRKLAVILAAALIFTQLPQTVFTAYADETGEQAAETVEAADTDTTEEDQDKKETAETVSEEQASDSDTGADIDETKEDDAVSDNGTEETTEDDEESVSDDVLSVEEATEDTVSEDEALDETDEDIEEQVIESEDNKGDIEGNYVYEVNSDGKTCKITGHTSSFTSGALNIPSTINGYTVTAIGGAAFQNKTGFTSLTIPSTVTEIDDSAFSECYGLKGTLNIPESVTSIGNKAFYYCNGFTALKLPKSVKSIGSQAFQGFGNKATLTLAEGLTTLGTDSTFYNAVFKGTLTIPASVQKIPDNAFDGCSGFTKLAFKSGSKLTSIGNYAFSYCSGFKGTLSLPATVTTIGNNAFYGCSGFTGSLKLPGKLKSLGSYAFGKFTGITGTLTIPSTLTTYTDLAFYDMNYVLTIVNNSTKKLDAGQFISSSDEDYAYFLKKNTKKPKITYKGKLAKGTYSRYNGELSKVVLKSVTNSNKGLVVKYSSVPGANQYYIYRSGKLLKKTNKTSYTDTNTKNGAKYSYFIYAYNTKTKNWSSESSNGGTAYRIVRPTINKLTAASKAMTVKWGKNAKSSGYEIQYSTSSKFTNAKTVTVTKASTISKKIKGLTGNKKYYFRIRSYKKSGKTKYYSAWSAASNAKTKK